CVTRLVILAAIATIAIPIFTNKSTTSKQIANNENVRTLQEQGNAYLLSLTTMPADGEELIDDLETNGYIKQIPTNPLTGLKDYSVKYHAATGAVLVTLVGSSPPAEEPEPFHETEVPDGYVGIYKIEDLYNVRNTLTANYIVMAYLDFTLDSSYTNPNDTSFGDINGNGTTEGIKIELTTGAGWLPVGNISEYFIGIFNGNGYVIKNLYINSTIANCTGLFGNNRGTIKQLGLENVNVTGTGDGTGGLVGYNSTAVGKIQDCYVSGQVTGQRFEGGIVGYNYNSGVIERCYSLCNVIGTGNFAGGLVGNNNSGAIIRNCYATGNATSTAYVGVIGYNEGGTYTNNYRLDTATATAPGGGVDSSSTVITQVELQSEIFTVDVLGWDLTTTWKVVENGYQTLGGIGTSLTSVPKYQIYKVEDLYTIRLDIAGSYELMNDLDFNNQSDYINVNNKGLFTTGAGWLPVGTISTYFTGIFNGNGHVIKNLYINRNSINCIGLFGNNRGTIKQLGLENVNVTGTGDGTGGLVGYNSTVAGKIQDCYVSGQVNGQRFEGGIVGYNYNSGVIERCYSLCNVIGTGNFAGGLVGDNNSGAIIRNCYAIGNATSTAYVGVIGYNEGGTYTNNYRLDTATATAPGGGVDSSGIVATQADLQSVAFLSTTLTWDMTTIWQENVGWPVLR
ncbi:MAG TPA: hypothetical protein DCP90_00510, partial [Clostridiales bacterium]|nr:hypothetical protein [Clostridiales bacterium]